MRQRHAGRAVEAAHGVVAADSIESRARAPGPVALFAVLIAAMQTGPPAASAADGPPGAAAPAAAGASGAAFGQASAAPAPEHMRREQLIALMTQAEVEIRRSIALGDSAEQSAYRQKDLIRLTCVKELLAHIKAAGKLIEQRLERLRSKNPPDDFSLRSDYVVVRQIRERANVLMNELEMCVGDDVRTVVVVDVAYDPPGAAPGQDPTQPALIPPTVERPPEASFYR